MSKKVVVLTAAMLALSFLFSACGGNSFDYNGDMSKYVTLSDDALHADIQVGKQPIVDDTVVRNQIGENAGKVWPYDDARYTEPEKDEEESSTAEESATETSTEKATVDNPAYVKDTAVTDNALTYIYYFGVTKDDGKPFTGGSNLSNKTPYALMIGSKTFVDDFEEELKGVIPSDTSLATTGTVKEDSVVFLTITTTYKVPAEKEGEKDKEEKYADLTYTTIRVDLSSDTLLADLVREKAVEKGLNTSFEVTSDVVVKEKTYTATSKVKVTHIVEDVAVEVTFPDDYGTKDLQGQDAIFYVVVDGYLAFEDVAKKLGDNKTEFKAEEGKALYESYYDHVEKQLVEEYEETKIANRYMAIWDYLMATAKIDVPFSLLAQYYDEAEENWRYTYENGAYYGVIPYEQIYKTFDDMMEAKYKTKQWEDALHDECETAIKERILLHYMIDELGVSLTSEEIQEVKDYCKENNISYKKYGDDVKEQKLWEKVVVKLDSEAYITVTEAEDTADEATDSEGTEGATEESTADEGTAE